MFLLFLQTPIHKGRPEFSEFSNPSNLTPESENSHTARLQQIRDRQTLEQLQQTYFLERRSRL